MKVLKENPPNFDLIKEKFEVQNNTVFTYGDTIYAPKVDFELPPDLIAHEKTHQIQQGADPDAWWNKYLEDRSFRFDQELEAYRNQYKFYCKFNKDRNARSKFLVTIAQDLSGGLYDINVGFFSCVELIQNGIK